MDLLELSLCSTLRYPLRMHVSAQLFPLTEITQYTLAIYEHRCEQTDIGVTTKIYIRPV